MDFWKEGPAICEMAKKLADRRQETIEEAVAHALEKALIEKPEAIGKRKRSWDAYVAMWNLHQ